MIGLYYMFKRVFDFFLSLSSMVFFSPVLIVLALCVYISDGWPVIFSSERMGKDGKIFKVYKFRTLVNGVERRNDGLADKIVINRLTGFMRNTHLDEVLQMFNVVKGDMSLIGPRPLDIPRYNHLISKTEEWKEILKVKPGMTCLNQLAKYWSKGMDKVMKLQDMSIDNRNRLFLDRYYIQHESLALDLRIKWWTLCYLVSGFFIKMFKKAEFQL
jgi:lipopolysaccharide/colanic/teichoic acid biosynthesis glycosyltransferase